MIKYTNDYGKECYREVDEDSPFDSSHFHIVEGLSEDIQWALHTNLGSLTVLDRMTGYGYRDVETGYRDPEGLFWLASGDHDVRYSGAETIGEAIVWVKQRANTCVGA